MRIIAISALPLWVMGEGKGLPSVYYGVKRLVDAGHEVHFVTPTLHLWNRGLDAEFRKKPNDELYNGIQVHRFGIPLLPFLRNAGFVRTRTPRILRYAKHVQGFLSSVMLWCLFTVCALIRAGRIARDGKPDAVIAHNGIAAAAAFVLAKRYKVPHITKIYGTFLSQIPWNPFHLLIYFSQVMGFKIPCDYLIVDNDGTQGDKVAARLGVPEARLKFLMNGVDKDMYDSGVTVAEAKKRLHIAPEQKVTLTLGRLDTWKGVDKLLRAVPEIVADHSNLLVLIVGDGIEMTALVELSHGLEIENWVRFEGSVPHARVKEYLHAADIFVSTQNATNFGVHVMEAMTSGKCIVTLNNGDTGKYITNGETGILLEPDRLDLLPSTIIRLLRDDELRVRLGLNARLYADQHFQTWDERMDTEVKLLENLVERRSQR